MLTVLLGRRGVYPVPDRDFRYQSLIQVELGPLRPVGAVHVGKLACHNGTIGRGQPTQNVHCIMQTKDGQAHSQSQIILQVSSASCKRGKSALVEPRYGLRVCTPSCIWRPVSFLEMVRSA